MSNYNVKVFHLFTDLFFLCSLLLTPRLFLLLMLLWPTPFWTLFSKLLITSSSRRVLTKLPRLLTVVFRNSLWWLVSRMETITSWKRLLGENKWWWQTRMMTNAFIWWHYYGLDIRLVLLKRFIIIIIRSCFLSWSCDLGCFGKEQCILPVLLSNSWYRASRDLAPLAFALWR